jgi:hypothetical protein
MGAPLFITKFEYLERVEGPTLPESPPKLAASETVADNASKVEADPDKAEGKKQKADFVGAGHVRASMTDYQPTTDDRRPMTDPQLTVHYYTNHQLSTYDWEYTDYLKRWNEQTRFYWAQHPPTEYLSGEHPQGGEVWVTVKVNRDGRILDTQAQTTGELPESVQEVALRAVDTVLLPPLPF